MWKILRIILWVWACSYSQFHIHQIRFLALAQCLISAAVKEKRTAVGRSLVLPLIVREEETEGGSVLARTLVHQRYEESFHPVSCESERMRGGRKGEERLWLALSWVSHLSNNATGKCLYNWLPSHRFIQLLLQCGMRLLHHCQRVFLHSGLIRLLCVWLACSL